MFRSNTLRLVAGLAALKQWRDSRLSSHVELQGRIVSTTLRTISSKNSLPSGSTRGIGLVHGIDFGSGAFARAVRFAAFEQGLLIETCGCENAVIKIQPPLNIEPIELYEGLRILDEAIDLARSIS